jgi:addiction module HigA family antidote
LRCLRSAAEPRETGISRRGPWRSIKGRGAITADTDLRLARYWGLSEGFWLGLQADHDLMERRRELGPALDRITPRAP